MKKRNFCPWFNRIISSVVVKVSIMMFIFIFVSTGCFLIKSMQDIDKTMETTVIVGQVFVESPINGPIIVAAYTANEEKEIAHYTVLHEAGEYELAVDQGSYYVFTFIDINSNLVYDKGEPFGQYGDPKLVFVPAVGVVYDINMSLGEQNENAVISSGTIISPEKSDQLISRQAGAIVHLDDALFDKENGKTGFWEPVSFYKRFGGNIYFLEKYDPEKTPVLFIHGATGTPRDFEDFVNNLDTTRFQPWLFYYPSGSRLNSMSYLLYWKLSNLQAKYQFSKIYFTAHSMGGLIAKSFIVTFGQQFPYVKLFISLATPWGGDSMAEYGVEQSPLVIPSWRDMQPNSDFIKSLYAVKLPETTRFYMFYGYKGSSMPFQSNDDGTIDLSSLLDYRSQSEAKKVFAFNENHVSILSSLEAIQQYNSLLNAFEDQQNEINPQAGGYIKIHFDYTYETEGAQPRLLFLLHHRGEEDAKSVRYLSDKDSGKILGPFSPGEYTANLVDERGGVKSENTNSPVTIDSSQTIELNFVLKPDGIIGGRVTAPLKTEDKILGSPDYTYREVNNQIRIESITLDGNGIHRTLQQIRGEESRNYNFLIARKDLCYNTFFVFFGLPAGSYNIVIKVEGYKPVMQKYTVIPGIPRYYRITELEPELTIGNGNK